MAEYVTATEIENADSLNMNDSLSVLGPVNDTASSKGTASPSKSLCSSTSTSAENISVGQDSKVQILKLKHLDVSLS